MIYALIVFAIGLPLVLGVQMTLAPKLQRRGEARPSGDLAQALARRQGTPLIKTCLVAFGLFAVAYIGYLVGCYAYPGRDTPEIPAMLLSALICAVPAALIVWFMPRRGWLFVLPYLYGFHYGYLFFSRLAQGIHNLGLIVLSALFRQPVTMSPGPSHPELIGFYLLALGFAGWAYLLRRQHIATESC